MPASHTRCTCRIGMRLLENSTFAYLMTNPDGAGTVQAIGPLKSLAGEAGP